MKGNLGTAVPPGSPVVLDRASDTLVPCTQLLCPYAIPSARDSNVLVNFVPISTSVIVTYLPSPSLAVDNSAALGAFASRNTAHDQEYRQAFTDALLPRQPPASTPPEPGGSDAAIAAAVAAVAHRSGAIANTSVTIDPRPFLRLGYDLRDTVAMLQPQAEMLAFNNSFRGIPCPGVSYFRCAACAGPSPAHSVAHTSGSHTHLTLRSIFAGSFLLVVFTTRCLLPHAQLLAAALLVPSFDGKQDAQQHRLHGRQRCQMSACPLPVCPCSVVWPPSMYLRHASGASEAWDDHLLPAFAGRRWVTQS
jgi:hypothetical protein